MNKEACPAGRDLSDLLFHDGPLSLPDAGVRIWNIARQTKLGQQISRTPMDFVSLIGYVASVCSVVSFLPQALKVIRTKNTEAISARMYLLTVMGFALWTTFGIMKGELPIIVANSICFCLSAFILGAKLKGSRR